MGRNLWQKTLAGTLLTGFLTAGGATAGTKIDSTELRELITGDNIYNTLVDLGAMPPRVPGTPGYDMAAEYVANELEAAGYSVVYQTFDFDLWEELTDPVLEQISPDPEIYPPYDAEGFATMEYSGSGDVTALVVKADNFGCDPADFTADYSGKIALIERGECTFFLKAENAQNAGAAAAVVYNDEARQDAFLGTLGGPGVAIPVVGTSYGVGLDLQNVEPVTAMVTVDAEITTVETANVLAETAAGRDDRVVVVGAHLDGVAETTAINDNGSGSAVILEIAKQLAALEIEPENKILFAFWSAEESGLIGSEYYVNSLTAKEQKKIALNLNFDMLGSPNYVRFVYDGDGSATPDAGPNGSGNIEKVFADYFNSVDLPFEETAFDGRSDYGPFIDAGIPAGGLFTGADEIKTKEQAEVYGGTAGEMLDQNYHTPDDDLGNVNQEVLGEMADGAAHAVLTFGMTQSAVNGTAKASSKAKPKMMYKGPKAQR